MRDAAALCPLDRLLVETDAPTSPRCPTGANRTVPAWVPHVGRFIADLRGLDADEIAEATSTNAAALFGL